MNILANLDKAILSTRPYFLASDPNWDAASGRFLVKLAGSPRTDLSVVMPESKIPDLLDLLADFGKQIEKTPMAERQRLFDKFSGIIYLRLLEWIYSEPMIPPSDRERAISINIRTIASELAEIQDYLGWLIVKDAGDKTRQKKHQEHYDKIQRLFELCERTNNEIMGVQ